VTIQYVLKLLISAYAGAKFVSERSARADSEIGHVGHKVCARARATIVGRRRHCYCRCRRCRRRRRRTSKPDSLGSLSLSCRHPSQLSDATLGRRAATDVQQTRRQSDWY
jgi:hypothetical protein